MVELAPVQREPVHVLPGAELLEGETVVEHLDDHAAEAILVAVGKEVGGLDIEGDAGVDCLGQDS